MYALPGPETDSGAFGLTAAVATVAWVMGGGYENSPVAPSTNTWSDGTTPTTSEATALAILAAIVANGSFVFTNKGEESVEYQLWRLGVLPEDHFDLPEALVGDIVYDTTRQKDYWYDGIPNHQLLDRLLELIKHELGQESVDFTTAWLEGQYYTDTRPRQNDGYEGFTSTWDSTGFEVETRNQAINRLIWVTTYWRPSENSWGTSFRMYIHDNWLSLIHI